MTADPLAAFEDDFSFPRGDITSIKDAWAIMAGGAPNMVKVLINIAMYGKSEVARVQAAMAVLDRVGLAGKPDIAINVLPDNVMAQVGAVDAADAGAMVRARLQILHKSAQIVDGSVDE